LSDSTQDILGIMPLLCPEPIPEYLARALGNVKGVNDEIGTSEERLES